MPVSPKFSDGLHNLARRRWARLGLNQELKWEILVQEKCRKEG